MRSAIEEIKTRLSKYPEVKVETKGNWISVMPPDADGFCVSLLQDGEQCTVNFESWHEEFDDMNQALESFAFGLSEYCRLKVESRGDFDYIWTVQECDDTGEWFDCARFGLSTTGLLVFPFWKRKRVRYLHNHLIRRGAETES